MKVEELYEEMATSDSHLAHLQQANNEDYEAVVEALDPATGPVAVQIKSVRWEHDEKRMVLETV